MRFPGVGLIVTYEPEELVMEYKRTKFRARCWHCGKENDSAAPANHTDEDAVPNNGDLLLCFRCGAFMVVDKDMPDNVHKPTPAENREIAIDKNLKKIYEAWLAHKLGGN